MVDNIFIANSCNKYLSVLQNYKGDIVVIQESADILKLNRKIFACQTPDGITQKNFSSMLKRKE